MLGLFLPVQYGDWRFEYNKQLTLRAEAIDAHAWRGHQVAHRYVRDIIRLRQAGIDGIHLSFFDFAPDLEQFGARVLPLLYQAGLRH
jgi:FMNH2-dependent dimethyl sulfone monooxygenase